MPGRQSHGRSLLGESKASSSAKGKGKGKPPKSKTKSRAHALDAFAIAAKQIEPDRITRRGRDLDLDPERESRGGKHRRDEDEEDDSDEDEEEDAPQRKRAKKSAAEDEDDDADDRASDFEGGSDSEGNEWHMGVNSDDDDSDIDSDEAFGESDDDKFEGFTFRGSHSKKEEDEDEDGDDDGGDDGASLGSDAIDLADALDQSSDDDDEGSAGDTESGSEGDESADEEEDDGEGSEDDDVDPSKLSDLQNLIRGFADTDPDAEADDGPPSKQAISLQDLGLGNVKDPLIKKSVKLMKKEEKAKATKKGSSKKLDVPLPRRQQDQLLRAAAYEKTNEVLDRWNETVKQNRRADHLMFPLPHTLADAGLDNGELLPLTKKTAGNELEQTIMSIMEESGLGPSAKSKDQPKTTDAKGEEQTISRTELKELWAQRRKEREKESREQARAKRIKKIKSKTYRRIHRKQRLGDEAEELEQMRERGEIDSEEEREAAHRRRALERVGARHKDSKWAKMGSKAGRAVWDDDYRAGLTDMARRNEELRRRVEGKTGTGDDNDESDAASSSGDENGNSRLLDQLDALDEVEDEDDHPHADLMKLKFMQTAEARKKKENDELVAQIRRDLESGSEQEEEDDDAEAQMGRRTFGMGQKKSAKPGKQSADAAGGAISNGAKPKMLQGSKTLKSDVANEVFEPSSAPGAAGSWSRTGQSAVSERKKGRKATSSAEGAELQLDGAVQLPSKAKNAPASTTNAPDDDDSSDDGIHMPLAIQDLELASRAFGGEDTVAEFEAEKEAVMSEDDEKIIDNTMPGWGSWTGDGISKRAQKRNKGKVMTKKDGIKKKDRKDAKLERVIVNEKRNRKVRRRFEATSYSALPRPPSVDANDDGEQNEKYLASQLPHPFESRLQYERSLRLPVGPEWMTKESFQQATKPRVLVKQGIIAPMAKPTI